MIRWRKKVEEYVELRRSLGFKLLDAKNGLIQFASFLEQSRAAHITIPSTKPRISAWRIFISGHWWWTIFWIPLGENMMIEQFKPIWNLVIDGFGNKDPGRRRATQYRSPWDVLHPGRQFAEKLATGGATAEVLVTRLKEYFAGQVVPLVPAEEAGDIGTTEDDED
jgi:Eco29kI restriction endonuclease